MALTGLVLSSLFYRDRAQWEKDRQEVNIHCCRTIYRFIYPLLMDRLIESTGVCKSEEVAEDFVLNCCLNIKHY